MNLRQGMDPSIKKKKVKYANCDRCINSNCKHSREHLWTTFCDKKPWDKYYKSEEIDES